MDIINKEKAYEAEELKVKIDQKLPEKASYRDISESTSYMDEIKAMMGMDDLKKLTKERMEEIVIHERAKDTKDKEIAEMLGVSLSTIARIKRKLKQEGRLKDKPSPEDEIKKMIVERNSIEEISRRTGKSKSYIQKIKNEMKVSEQITGEEELIINKLEGLIRRKVKEIVNKKIEGSAKQEEIKILMNISTKTVDMINEQLTQGEGLKSKEQIEDSIKKMSVKEINGIMDKIKENSIVTNGKLLIRSKIEEIVMCEIDNIVIREVEKHTSEQRIAQMLGVGVKKVAKIKKELQEKGYIKSKEKLEEEVKQMILDRMTYKKIAQITGKSIIYIQGVKSRMKEDELPIYLTKQKREWREAVIIRESEKGTLQADIADLIGTSVGTVRIIKKKLKEEGKIKTEKKIQEKEQKIKSQLCSDRLQYILEGNKKAYEENIKKARAVLNEEKVLSQRSINKIANDIINELNISSTNDKLMNEGLEILDDLIFTIEVKLSMVINVVKLHLKVADFSGAQELLKASRGFFEDKDGKKLDEMREAIEEGINRRIENKKSSKNDSEIYEITDKKGVKNGETEGYDYR